MRPSRLPIAAAIACLATLSLRADVMAAAIVRAVRRAASVAGYPAPQDLT